MISDQLKAQVISVTPELATEWLARGGVNRRVSQKHVMRLAQQMKDGQWLLNGEAIKFNINGELLDGQHRLAAILRHGKPVEMMVICGMPTETFSTLDTGKRRNLADALSIVGEKNVFELAASLTLLWRFQHGVLTGIARDNYPSHADCLRLLASTDGLRPALTVAQGVRKHIRIRSSVVAVAYFLTHAADPEGADKFFKHLKEGTGLSMYDPIFRLRERMLAEATARQKMTQTELLALFIKAWNYWRVGREVQQLVWKYRAGEEFPEVQGDAA